jgi:hypothetical protein
MAEAVGPHRRAPWTAAEPDLVFVAASYGIVKEGGGQRDRGKASRLRDDYQAAKFARDAEAALRVVDAFCGENWYEDIVAQVVPYIEAGKRIIFVWPMPGFAEAVASSPVKPVTNALPAAIAQRLYETFGGSLNDAIIQIARPGRTKLKRMERFLYQPSFGGKVDTNACYVVVDDAYTTGGTLAALRSYIVENGGTVAALGALCCSKGNGARTFRLAKANLDVLLSMYGRDFIPFWLKEVGHGVESLTDDEGTTLISWGREDRRGEPLLQCLRDCFDSIRSKGVEP